MRDRQPGAGFVSLVGLLLVALVSPGCVVVDGEGAPGPAHTVERPWSRSLAISPGTGIEVENLAGEIVVEDGAEQLQIEAIFHGGADSEDAARALVESLDVDVEQEGDQIGVRVRYPVDRHDTYHYPGGKIGPEFLSWLGGSQTRTRYQGERVTVVSTRRGSAVTLYVDLTLRVPDDVSVVVRNGVGRIEATDLRGDLEADTASGEVSVTGSEGRLLIDTGSGGVEVEDHAGDVRVDTGSGDVDLRGVRGSVVAETGSGGVRMTDVEGDRIVADTGSGGVRLEGVSGSIEIDTGSGGIAAVDLRTGSRFYADTGSGGVEVSGDLSAAREVTVDTGSGGVRIELTEVPPMTLRISTGSGSIDVDLPDLEVLRKRQGHFEGRVGDGDAMVTIDTGSGSVRIRKAR